LLQKQYFCQALLPFITNVQSHTVPLTQELNEIAY